MKPYSIPALLIATVCLTIALSDSLIWIRRKRRQGGLAFILICLGGAAFCLCCAGEYNVDHPLQSIVWLKGEVIASTISGLALLWYVSACTGLVGRPALVLGVVWTLLSVASQVIDLGDLTWIKDQPFVLRVSLPFGLDFVYQEVRRGPVLVLITGVGFLFQLYLTWVNLRHYRAGKRHEALVLLLALGFILTAQILAVLTGLGLLHWVFLLEYAWVATILVVGLNRSRDFIEAESTRQKLLQTDQELQRYQATLDTMVDSTTDLIWSVDADARLLTFNQAFGSWQAARLGRPPLQGERFDGLAGPGSQAEPGDAAGLTGADAAGEGAFWDGILRRGQTEGHLSFEYQPEGTSQVLLVGVHRLQRDGRLVGLAYFARNITAQKAAEDLVRHSLAEKEVLLREVHHRTKNNMNVIVSLLRLQANRQTDPGLKAVLGLSIDRIMAMSMVHNQLYLAGNLGQIDLGDYLAELADHLVASHPLPEGQARLVTGLESVPVPIETAINCGMIVNELVTNALRHAFPPGRGAAAAQDCRIRLELRSLEGPALEVLVADNGIGLPAGFDPESSAGLGCRLVQTLARDSLQAKLACAAGPGTCWTLTFTPEAASPEPDQLTG